MSSNETYHPLTWLVWLVAAVLPALSTRNPLYLSLTLLAAMVTYLALGRRSQLAQSWGSFVRFGALLWLITIPFAALTNHYGDVVLFRLPAGWPIIGGIVTLESLLYGVTGGLAVLSLLLVFAVFNVAVDQGRLLRMTPGFIYQAGVITAIAVAFVPQMVLTWQSIREAQQVRGHRVRGARDLLPLIMPLLITALERAMQLSESMEARGFGQQVMDADRRERTLGQLLLLGGLGIVGVGFGGLGFWPEKKVLLAVLIATGSGLLLWSFWRQGRRVRRTRYRHWRWTRLDRWVLACCVVSALGWLAAWLFGGDLLFYYPYPPYSPWPAFNPLLGLSILTLAIPGILLPPIQPVRGDVAVDPA